MPGAPLPSCPEAPSSPSHLPESVHVRSYRHESITWLPNEKGCPWFIERFHSHGQHLCKFIGTKESVCIRKEFNSHGTGLGHQHDRRFIVLGHQSGRRDVMWKHSIEPYVCVIISPIAREEVGRGLVLKMFWILNQPWFTQNVVVMDLVISLTQNLFLDPPLPQANSCLFLVRWWYKC